MTGAEVMCFMSFFRRNDLNLLLTNWTHCLTLQTLGDHVKQRLSSSFSMVALEVAEFTQLDIYPFRMCINN